MAGTDVSSGTNILHEGDSATILGAFVQRDTQIQWVLNVEAAAPDPKNDATNKEPPLTVNLFGTPITFESKPVPAKLRMLGPFSAGHSSNQLKAEEHHAQFSLNESFLGVGLDKAAAVIWHRNQMDASDNSDATNATPGTNSISKTRGRGSDKKLTPAEQRALSGAVPTLTSYFEIVHHTEGLKELLFKVVKLPSLWSVIKHRGVSMGLFFGKDAFPANPADWGLSASTPVYYLPCDVRLNGQLAIKITLVVTTPQPPLLICGGVIALLAEKPGDDKTYLTMRVISAKCATKPDAR
jgi:hypothetical protein